MNKYLERVYNGLIKENPTFVLMLGMCPTLAITTSATNGIGMGLTTTVILAASNLMISLLRNFIPDRHQRIPAHESNPMVSPVLLLENIRSYCYSPIILIKTNHYDFQFLSNIGIVHLHRLHKSTTNQEQYDILCNYYNDLDSSAVIFHHLPIF